jgi:translation initiation factor 1
MQIVDFQIDLEPVNAQIHIRIKQRNQRKCITFVENLAQDLNINKILKEMKKTFHCNGSVDGSNIQLSGDHRQAAKNFLVENNIIKDNNIIIHGY